MDWTTEPANPAMQKWRVSTMTVLLVGVRPEGKSSGRRTPSGYRDDFDEGPC